MDADGTVEQEVAELLDKKKSESGGAVFGKIEVDPPSEALWFPKRISEIA